MRSGEIRGETNADEIPIVLPFSLAFGSGLHPATMLSLQLIERHATAGMQALDLGCGSGILSIALSKLGLQVLALDNDPIAVQATQAAINLNGVESLVRVQSGSLGGGNELGHWMGGLSNTASYWSPTAEFDLIAANLLARIHVTLASDYQQALRPSGLLILAGFDQDYEPEVASTLAQVGLYPIDRQTLGEWVALTCKSSR